jgi:ABC-2 type transport system permease protein
MTSSILRLEARRSRTLTLWIVVVALVYGGFMAALYPTLKANSQLLEDYLNILPKEFLAAFGIEGGGLADPGVFFSTYIGAWLWPVLAALAAILLATRPVAADLDRGFIELPLSTPTPRARYLGITIAVHAVALVAMAIATVAGFIVVGLVVGAGFDSGRLLLVALPAAALAFAIHGVATALSVETLSRGTAGGITAGVLLAMYLLNSVARLQPDLEWLGAFSAFRYFDVRALIDAGTLDLSGIALFLAVALGGWALATWRFRTRDLVA